MDNSADLRQRLLAVQRSEITSHHIYRRIASTLSGSSNRLVLQRIANDELGHYETLRRYTGQDVAPQMSAVWLYDLLNRLFGFTFAAKLLEKGEADAPASYGEIAAHFPEAASILAEEDEHEEKLLGMLDEERLHYASSVVLGLNDALVELTGTLAGLTLALHNVQLIALSGLITGVAAAFSMAASEYLSTKAEQSNKQPVRAAVYTGLTYILTVTLLILPYLLLDKEYLCLAITIATGVLVIAVFNYYIAVARGEDFRKRFLEMAAVSLGVAAVSFVLSYFIRMWLGVEV